MSCLICYVTRRHNMLVILFCCLSVCLSLLHGATAGNIFRKLNELKYVDIPLSVKTRLKMPDAAHRIQQGVLYFHAVMPLHSTQTHVASVSLITKSAYGFHRADFYETRWCAGALVMCSQLQPDRTLHVDSTDRHSLLWAGCATWQNLRSDFPVRNFNKIG
jgi:hypothetical protein